MRQRKLRHLVQQGPERAFLQGHHCASFKLYNPCYRFSLLETPLLTMNPFTSSHSYILGQCISISSILTLSTKHLQNCPEFAANQKWVYQAMRYLSKCKQLMSSLMVWVQALGHTGWEKKAKQLLQIDHCPLWVHCDMHEHTYTQRERVNKQALQGSLSLRAQCFASFHILALSPSVTVWSRKKILTRYSSLDL